MWPLLLLFCLKSPARPQRIKIVNSTFQNLIHLYEDCIYENQDMTSRYNTGSCSPGKNIFRNNYFHDYKSDQGGTGINIGAGDDNILEFVNNRFNNINGASGAAIYLKGKKVDIIGNTFSNLHSFRSAAVYCEANSKNIDFTLTGNTFKSITSVLNGGGICFGIAAITFNGANNTFDTVSSDEFGGGINFLEVQTISATFRNDTFVRANSNFGGGIRFNCQNGNIYMYDCYFEDCTGKNSDGGGALALDLINNGATYSVYLYGLTFNNVKASTGSVIRLWHKVNTMKIVISKSDTKNCTIQDIDNSPLFYIAPASLEVSWTNIMRTKGTIFRNPDKDGVKFTIDSCTLENCQETGNGLFQQRWNEIYIKNTILDNCQKIFNIQNNHLMSFSNTIFRNIPNQECAHIYSGSSIYNWSYVNCEFDNSQYFLKIDPGFKFSTEYQLVYSNCRFYRMPRAHKVSIESWGLFKDCVSYDCPMFEILNNFRKIVIVNCSGTSPSGPIISMTCLNAKNVEDFIIEDCSFKVASGNAMILTVGNFRNTSITNCKFEGESQDPSLVINGKVKLEGCTFGPRRKYKRAIKFDGGQLTFSLTSLNCIPISFNKTFEVSADNWGNIVDSDNIEINRWDTSNNLCYDDSLTKTETVQFSESIQFTNSIAYTNSNDFHASNDFSRSLVFMKTGNFLMTNDFSRSLAFMKTGNFLMTNEFLVTNTFTESNDFFMSKVFSYSNYFINTKEFQATSSFKETNKFIETSLFSITQEFINSKEFSISAHFESSKTLSKSNLFSYSKEMQKTNIFSSTNEFYESISFNKSAIFIQTKLLSESSLFIQSVQVSHSEKFLETKQFSMSRLMSNSNAYSSSVLFSNVVESSEADSSYIENMYSSSNQGVTTTTIHEDGLGSSIKLDESGIESLTVTSTLRLSSIDHNIYGSSFNQPFQSITNDPKTESPVVIQDSSENEYFSSLLKENSESIPTKDEQIYESSHISKEIYESVETTSHPDHLTESSLRDHSKLEMSSNHIGRDESSEDATNEFNDYSSLEKNYSSLKQDSQNIFVSEKTTEDLKFSHDSYSSEKNGATSLEANKQTSETSFNIQIDNSQVNSHEDQSIDKPKSVENSIETSIYGHHTSKDNLQSSETNSIGIPSSEHVNDEHQSLETNKEEKSSFISDDRHETTNDVTLKQTATCEKSSLKGEILTTVGQIKTETHANELTSIIDMNKRISTFQITHESATNDIISSNSIITEGSEGKDPNDSKVGLIVGVIVAIIAIIVIIVLLVYFLVIKKKRDYSSSLSSSFGDNVETISATQTEDPATDPLFTGLHDDDIENSPSDYTYEEIYLEVENKLLDM